MSRRPEESSTVDAWGIQSVWVDAQDESRTVSDDVTARLRAAIGHPPDDLDDFAPIVARPGQDLGLGTVDVACEDGATRQVQSTLSADFPLGYHVVHVDGRERTLIVSPGRCWLPAAWRAWGWAVQLYAARSRRSWGIGDLRDLQVLREWSQSLGAGFLLVNPLHAVAPTTPQENSPYLPTTRRFRNPIYLDVDGLASELSVDVGELSRRGRALNDLPTIDRDAVWRIKSKALRQIFSVNHDRDDFRAWREEQGSSLRQFALWCALAVEHGPDWRTWHPTLHDPDGDAARRFAERSEEEVLFHAWLQWQMSRQLRSATRDFTIVQDLPIGVDAGGADAWVWQDLLAEGVTIGAPPDFFNPAGQEWGSPPPTPWRLRAQGYRAFVEAIRSTMAHGGGLRVDHVMGLFRLWWVATAGSPQDGAYVRYPSSDLLDIVALESHRAKAVVVGEDLGTVEPGVRPALADHDVLAYRLLYFEDGDPATWPPKSMAAVTTHDLPTVAGLWTGEDRDEQFTLTGASRDEVDRGRSTLVGRIATERDLSDDTTAQRVTEVAYRHLAQAPSVLLSATLEDAVQARRRPNLPGASDRDNWCLPLPVRVDDLASCETAALLATILSAAVTATQSLENPHNG